MNDLERGWAMTRQCIHMGQVFDWDKQPKMLAILERMFQIEREFREAKGYEY